MRLSAKRIFALFFFSTLCLTLITGCFGRTKPPYVIDQYTLDYTSAVTAKGPAQFDELIRVERFSVAPAFNTTAMVIKTRPYRYDTYNYSRWRVNPADMVSGFILRDITGAGLFKGTYSSYDSDLSRYILDGHIDEFCESTETSPDKALLSVRVTLLDTAQKNPVEQVVFQKQYTHSVPTGEHSPDGLAAGLSEAMKKLSEQIIGDIRTALKDRAGK